MRLASFHKYETNSFQIFNIDVSFRFKSNCFCIINLSGFTARKYEIPFVSSFVMTLSFGATCLFYKAHWMQL